MIEIETDLETGEPAAAGLPIEARVQLLQIAREALSNAARHSRASRARIELGTDDEWLTLRIEDNGVGFDPDATRDGRHLGLVNLRGRAAALGGSLAVDSRPGDGASIIVRLPRPRPIAARPSEGSGDQPPPVSAAE
jgi:signal transduction histidine kinase